MGKPLLLCPLFLFSTFLSVWSLFWISRFYSKCSEKEKGKEREKVKEIPPIAILPALVSIHSAHVQFYGQTDKAYGGLSERFIWWIIPPFTSSFFLSPSLSLFLVHFDFTALLPSRTGAHKLTKELWPERIRLHKMWVRKENRNEPKVLEMTLTILDHKLNQISFFFSFSLFHSLSLLSLADSLARYLLTAKEA